MRSVIALCLISFLLLQGCSVVISERRDRKRDEIYSTVKVGVQRSEIVDVLGEPDKSENGNVDSYIVCIPKHGEADFNALMDIAFVLFWELYATPYELATPCDYKVEWVVTYDKNDNVAAIQRKGLYQASRADD